MIDAFIEKFKELPPEAILKTDLLRTGISFSPEALKELTQAKAKSYFIFSFDRVPQKELSELEKKAVPEEIALSGGPWNLKRTIVSVRVNPESPYRINYNPKEAEPFELMQNGRTLCKVTPPERPSYYNTPLGNGKPVQDIAPTIEWGYLIYLTAFRLCQYWGAKEECQFCDINENYRQQKKERSYTGIKTPEEIVEALSLIHEKDTNRETHAYTVTGGSITTALEGMDEATFYARYAEAIEERFPKRWVAKAVVQALPLEGVKRLKEAGYQIYHPNFEVWDKNLFSHLCPGKESYVGRDEWIKRIFDAAEIFGASNVIPNFVAGIEMAKPYGFKTVNEAIKSTAEGLDHFMSHGICPRFTVWCVEPGTVLSKTNSEPPPLDYFLRLLETYREIFNKHKLPLPAGYGPAGVGKAVFSVSAFMDVLKGVDRD
ncbi:MAG: radical SAM protein [Deltaproteobacteria bacterium]|nr:radical SAM protein [Deltaproteobacteria bacterium]